MARRGQECIPPATGETKKIHFERPCPTNLTHMPFGVGVLAVHRMAARDAARRFGSRARAATGELTIEHVPGHRSVKLNLPGAFRMDLLAVLDR